jgi:hypothetical protein
MLLILEEVEGGYSYVNELEVPKGRRLDVALRKWVEENGKEKKAYALLRLEVPAMKIKKVSKVEVVFA